MSNVPLMHPRIFFGLKTGIKGNALYISDHEILYPIGGALAVHNFTQKHQRFIRLPEKQKVISIICLSPNKKIAAVAEKGEKPCISLYDLTTLKRKKVLGLPFETTSHEFVSMTFTHDGKYIISIVGDPDWMMLCYNWEKGKVESSTKANSPNNPTGPVTQVVCNPTDNTVVCVVGPGVFRLLSVSETVWRQYGYQKADLLPITCACWLNFDRVLAGTEDGRLILVESGELKAMYKATDITVIDVKLTEPMTTSATSLNQDSSEGIISEVRELIAFTKGFAFAYGSGFVYLFEKETNHKYNKRNIFRLSSPECSDKMKDLDVIRNLTINLTGDVLLATTARTQLYSVRLWGQDIHQAPVLPFKMVGEQLHHGPVIGLATCAWKPIFMTCGELDRTVRVWNYEQEKQDLIKQYQEDIYSVALHPTGLYTVIGFSDKLRFMILLIDDIQSVREFPIRNCHECTFSTSGHLFAAVNGNIIQVYSSISHENIYNLKGHNGKVKSLVWMQNDSKLVSCGTEGAVYEWDVISGKRIGEVITKSCMFTGVVVTSDGKTSFGVGTDCQIKEISNSQVVRSVDVLGQPLDCVVLSRSDQMLFVSGSNGCIMSVKIPLREPLEFTEHNMHNRTVTRMCMSYDDQTIISCSEDGTICLWKLTFTEGMAVKMDKEFTYSTEILICKDDLEEKIHSIKDLVLRMQELETEHAYQMRQSEVANAEKMKDVHEGYCQAIEELKDKNEQLESEHTQEMNTINTDITQMKSSHENAMETLESSYNAKLIVEYDKYQLLEERTQTMRDDYEKQLTLLAISKQNALSDNMDNYEAQLHEKQLYIDELHEESNHQVKEHEEIKQQIEDDADREIVELKTHYEQLLKWEKEMNVRLRGETGVMKKKFISSQKEIDEFKHQVHTLQGEHQKFQQIIISLERDIVDLKKEINERDGTIQDKEKRIYDLKRKNQELEKFKFVLNYKIKELKNQIEPKEREIKEKKEQIQDMELELENLQKINTSLDLQLAELKEKLNAADGELKMERRHNRESNALLHRIRIDLHNTAGQIQEPKKLKESIKTLYHKYSQDEEFMSSRVQDEDAQMEFMRQREHLERTVASLKRQVFKDTGGKHGDSAKIMEDNVSLIMEINKLRKELKFAQRQITDLQSILGLSGKHMTPKEAQARLQTAVKSQEDIHNEYKKKIQDCEKVIALLKEEVQRLLQRLSKEDQMVHAEEQREKRKHIRMISMSKD